MTTKNNKPVRMSITKDILPDHVVSLLAYRPNPDRIATFLLDGVAFNPSRGKSEALEQLIKEHGSGGTIRKDGIKVVLNPFKNAVEGLQKREDKEDLLIWWKMKHKRHNVLDKDGDDATMGCWTMAVWAE